MSLGALDFDRSFCFIFRVSGSHGLWLKQGSDMVFKICGEWLHGGGGQEWKEGGAVRMPLCHREEGDCGLGDKVGEGEPPVIPQTSGSWIKPYLKLRFASSPKRPSLPLVTGR